MHRAGRVLDTWHCEWCSAVRDFSRCVFDASWPRKWTRESEGPEGLDSETLKSISAAGLVFIFPAAVSMQPE